MANPSWSRSPVASRARAKLSEDDVRQTQRTLLAVQIDGRTASVLSVHFFGDGEEPGSIETLTLWSPYRMQMQPFLCAVSWVAVRWKPRAGPAG